MLRCGCWCHCWCWYCFCCCCCCCCAAVAAAVVMLLFRCCCCCCGSCCGWWLLLFCRCRCRCLCRCRCCCCCCCCCRCDGCWWRRWVAMTIVSKLILTLRLIHQLTMSIAMLVVRMIKGQSNLASWHTSQLASFCSTCLETLCAILKASL